MFAEIMQVVPILAVVFLGYNLRKLSKNADRDYSEEIIQDFMPVFKKELSKSSNAVKTSIQEEMTAISDRIANFEVIFNDIASIIDDEENYIQSDEGLALNVDQIPEQYQGYIQLAQVLGIDLHQVVQRILPTKRQPLVQPTQRKHNRPFM
jgi:hypothetical protein